MTEPIYRAVYQIEVFSRGAFEDGSMVELSTIDYAIKDGDCIGDMTLVSNDVVPAEKVRDELLRIGNDGTFFDPVIDDDESESLSCRRCGEPMFLTDDGIAHHYATGDDLDDIDHDADADHVAIADND